MKTLILVDIQNDFMPGGTLAVPEGDRILEVVNRLQPAFDLVVATQDWHPASHLSFASNHPDKQPFEVIELDGLQQVLWPDHCVQGSAGAALHPLLDQHRIEAIFRKGMRRETDSYSAFYDNGHRYNTGLAGYLRDRGASDLYFCGLAADYCVWYSMQDALAEGFGVTLLEDATRPISWPQFEEVKMELVSRGGQIVHSEQ